MCAPSNEIQNYLEEKNIKKIVTKEGEVHIGTFPISIDFKEFSKSAAAEEVTKEVRIIRQNHENRQLILGVDRLDYTKGVPHRLRAFAEALARYPEIRGKIEFIQLVVPSRMNVDSYQNSSRRLKGSSVKSTVNTRKEGGRRFIICFVL